MALEVTDLRDVSPLPSEEDRIAARRRAFADAPADRYPYTAAAVDAIAHRTSTGLYVWGLHRVLDGITAATGGGAESGT